MSWSSESLPESKSRLVGFGCGLKDVVLFDGSGASVVDALVGVIGVFDVVFAGVVVGAVVIGVSLEGAGSGAVGAGSLVMDRVLDITAGGVGAVSVPTAFLGFDVFDAVFIALVDDFFVGIVGGVFDLFLVPSFVSFIGVSCFGDLTVFTCV